MPVIPRDPFDWLLFFRQQITVLSKFLSAVEQQGKAGECDCTPQVDVFETADKFIVEVDLPGIDRKDIAVSICCNTLVIEANKQMERGAAGVSYICLERCFGRFCKTVEIPPAVDADAAVATYDRGVLAISFPRPQNRNIIREIPIG